MKKIIIILTILALNFICFAQFGGGTGTVEDPYQIATADQLNQVRNYMTSSFIQTADIDLGVAPWNEGEGWDPIGDYNWSDPSKSFRGNYDGNGYKILNMNLNRIGRAFQGLFGSTEGCILVNIEIISFKIIQDNETGGYLGALSGISYNDNISNCVIEGNIEGNASIGLLSGSFEGYNIKNCHVKGKIKSFGSGSIGGIASTCNADSVIDCSSEITIIDSSNVKGGLVLVGGLLGRSFDTHLIENCFSKCYINVKKTNWSGGFIGAYDAYSSGMLLKNCYSEGIFLASPDSSNIGIGGFIGNLSGSSFTNSIISLQNCYSSVDVTGNDKVGGFIGRIYENSDVVNCYSTGQVVGNTNVGGFVGIIEFPENVTVSNSYWDTETSGIDSSAAGEGRTTAEMTLPYSGNTYVGWDFTSVWRDDVINQNDGYPTFLWVSGIEENDDDFTALVKGFELFQNYPNPFNPITQIKFDLAKTADVKLTVYNVNGQLVSELASGVLSAGKHSVEFDGSKLNTGIYYYTLNVDGNSVTKKMVLTK